MLSNSSEQLFFDRDSNPGLELKNFFKNLFPADKKNESSFINRIDHALKADNSLQELIYNSTINYLIRRFVNTAEFIRRKYDADEYEEPERLFIEELRHFIREETGIKGRDAEKLLAILLMCVKTKKQSRKTIKKRKFIKQNFSDRAELLCYMCGKSLTEDEVQIEHKFPKTMGGSNELSNLKIACEYCNNEKKNYIDASDFHYEHISLSTNDDDESFKLEFKRSYKIALWAKSDYSCALCGQPSEFIGRLNFVRRNPNDSWHFLNIDAVCEECLNRTEGRNDR